MAEDDERTKFEEVVTTQNCGQKLKLVQELSGMSRRELAKMIGVAESTVRRIELGESMPTDDFMQRLRALCVIGVEKFRDMQRGSEKKGAERLGAGGSAMAGLAGSLATISAAGSIPGLSAAGITSGLATIGGGAMLTGLGVIAAIPVAAGLAGYGLVKGIKSVIQANDLDSEEVNGRWELRNKPVTKKEEAE